MLYEEESGDILITLLGDSLVSRRLSPYREDAFLNMAELIRDADASVTNAETLFHEYEGFPTWEAGVYGTYVASDPSIIEDLKWLGIKMVACANNHACDYGEIGVLTNVENLNVYGMPHAGTGRNLTEAASPAYLDTPKGRVALISVTCTLPAARHRAGDPLGIIKGRPGANVLRHEVVSTVPSTEFETLRNLSRGLGLQGRPEPTGAAENEISFLGQRFIAGDEYARTTFPNQFDMDLNLKWIRDARRMADWVIVSMHGHERGATANEPAEFMKTFARACIDAGADVVHGHGPHRDRGIELYQGRPIFYSIGNFIMQNDVVKWEPWDAYTRFGLSLDSTPADMYDLRTSNETTGAVMDPIQWQSALARVRFQGGKLAEIRLHPIDLGFTTHKRSQRGRPVLAEGVTAQDILQRFQTLSEAFGTTIEIENDQGIVRCNQ